MNKYILPIFFVLFFIGCSNTSNTTIDNNRSKYTNTTTKADIVNNDFITENSLHDAVRADDLKLIKFLINEGVQIDKQDKYGYTPLHLAVRLHNYEITTYLIEQNANLNTRDNYKDTPLLDSTRNDDTNISEVLICNGAYRNVVDSHDMSTLNNSAKNKNMYILKMLRANHIEPYCQDEIEIDIKDVNQTHICGNILKGYVVDLNVHLLDSEETRYGDYIAKVNNENNTWCAPYDKSELTPVEYTINALGTDYVVNNATATKTMFLEPQIAIKITDVNSSKINTPLICGDIIKGDIIRTDITLEDSNNTIYGKYNAIINDINNTWCAQVQDTLPNGKYNILATGYNDNNETAQDTSDINITVPDNLGISIIDTDEIGDNKPTICGNIDKGDITRVDIMLYDEKTKQYGKYDAKIDHDDNTWCAKVTDELPNGEYDVLASGYDKDDNKADDVGEVEVYIIPGLYEALMTEFKDDFEPWGAELDKDTLTWRFKNPTVLFLVAKKDLRDKFEVILNDFFPRYVTVLTDYQQEIENVIIQGHSSSEHRLGNTIDEKYELNRILSQERANEVLDYTTNKSEARSVMNNIVWITAVFQAKGMSSSKLVYNNDGTENRK